jgi:hypothetical protein
MIVPWRTITCKMYVVCLIPFFSNDNAPNINMICNICTLIVFLEYSGEHSPSRFTTAWNLVLIAITCTLPSSVHQSRRLSSWFSHTFCLPFPFPLQKTGKPMPAALPIVLVLLASIAACSLVGLACLHPMSYAHPLQTINFGLGGGWAQIPNPMSDPASCGRTVPSHVCDPTLLFSSATRDVLDKTLARLAPRVTMAVASVVRVCHP